jgi:hypothetical protein
MANPEGTAISASTYRLMERTLMDFPELLRWRNGQT